MTGDLVGQAGWLQFESAPSPTCDATGAFAPGGEIVQAQRPDTADPSLQTDSWTTTIIFNTPGSPGSDAGSATVSIGLGAFGYAFIINVPTFPFPGLVDLSITVTAPGLMAINSGTLTLTNNDNHTLTLTAATGTLTMTLDGNTIPASPFNPDHVPSDLGVLVTWDGMTTLDPVHVARVAFQPL